MMENKEQLATRARRKRNAGVPHPDARRHALRLLGRDVDGALAQLHADGDAAAVERVEAAWRAFGALLDLGPDPEVTHCPSCGATVMVNATRCGHCWAPLQPRA